MIGRAEARLLVAFVGVMAGTTTLALEPGPLALRYRIQNPFPATELRFSPDGRVLAARATGTSYLQNVYSHSQLWEAATGGPLAWTLPPAEDAVLAFSPDGRRLVTRGKDGIARVREVASGKELLQLRSAPSGEVKAPVKVAAFSRNGQRVTTVGMGGEAGEVRVWNATSGAVLTSFELPGHTREVFFSPDGRYLLAEVSEKLLVWGVDSGRQLSVLALRSVLWAVAFSPDGTRVAFCVGHHSDSDFTTEVRDVRTGRRLAEFPVPGIVTPVFSPDGRRLLTAGTNAQLWDLKSGKKLVELAHPNIAAATFSPDGTRVATAGRGDHAIRLWEVPGGRALPQVLSHDNSLTAVAFSPDGQLLATTGEDLDTRVWGAPLKRKAGEAPAQEAPPSVPGLVHALELGGKVTQLAFTPDGHRLATASDDRSARVWDVATGRKLQHLTHEDRLVKALAFSPDGTRLTTVASEGYTGEVRVWELTSGCCHRLVSSLYCADPTFSFSADALRLAAGSLSGVSLAVWDLEAPRQLLKLPFTSGKGLSVLTLSPDGTRLATVSDERRRTELWDVASGRRLLQLATAGTVNQLAFSPDGTRLITAGHSEGFLTAWDAASGKPLLRLALGDIQVKARMPDPEDLSEKAARAWDQNTGAPVLRGPFYADARLVFSRDGKRLATVGHVWDLKTGKQLLRLPENLWLSEAFAFSADGRRFALSEHQKSARVFDVDSGRQLARFEHDTPIVSIALSPDGSLLATGDEGHYARLWKVDPGSARAPRPAWPEQPGATPVCPPTLTASGG